MIIGICLYAMFGLLYRFTEALFPFSRVFGIIVLLMLMCATLSTLKREDILLIVGLVMCSCASFCMATDFKLNLNDCIYWVSTIIFIWKLKDTTFCVELYEASMRRKKGIILGLLISNIVLIVGLFDKSCYSYVWGSKGYYMCYAYSNHTMASLCCLLLCVTLIASNWFKYDLIRVVMILPATYAILSSGARVFLISLVIICAFYYLYALRNKILKYLYTPVLLIGAVFAFLNSGMLQKILVPFENSKLSGLDSFTSGRTIFWKADILAFSNYSIINKLFGNGFDAPYIINLREVSMKIWSHNDLINCLLAVGLLGTGIYTYVLITSYKSFKNNKVLDRLMIIAYWCIIALVNGAFGYQHYLYSFVLLMIFVKFYSLKHNNRNITYEENINNSEVHST